MAGKKKSPLKGRKYKKWAEVSPYSRLAKWTGSKKSKVAGHERRTNPDSKTVDVHGARELYLVSVNDHRLSSMYEAICNNLAKKMAKGMYSIPLAQKGWGHFIKRAAMYYTKENGVTFNKATRDSASAQIESHERHGIEERAKDFAPKKKNPAPSANSRLARLRRISVSLRGTAKHERALSLLRGHREKTYKPRGRASSKTETVYVVQGRFGSRWEDVDQSTNPHASKRSFAEYCKNDKNHSYRLISRKEKK